MPSSILPSPWSVKVAAGVAVATRASSRRPDRDFSLECLLLGAEMLAPFDPFPPPLPAQCPAKSDVTTLVLSIGLCTGLIISYLPQHIRIISAGSSEGFSPWFLLLGATSSASGMLNLLILQWPVFRCCRVISGGRCLESLLGFIQVALQWLLFTIILILYLMYYPPHLKYQRTLPLAENPPTQYGAVDRPAHDLDEDTSVVTERYDGFNKQFSARKGFSHEWRLAIGLAVVVAIHLILLTLLSLVLLRTLEPTTPPHPLLTDLATFLGLSGTVLAVLQYAPQIYKTYTAKLVGALSIGTMVIQVPGSVLFVISIALREGTDWTSWIPYAVTGGMQGFLLVICILWKRRQKRLGVDDFGVTVLSDDARHPAAADPEGDERARLVG